MQLLEKIHFGKQEPVARRSRALSNMKTKESKFVAQDPIEPGLVLWMKEDQALAFLLVKLLFFVHADFVFGGVHAPVFDVEVEFGQEEVWADGVSGQDTELFVIAVSDTVRGEPVCDCLLYTSPSPRD